MTATLKFRNNSKRARCLINSYLNSNAYRLEDIYTTCSHSKYNAYESCFNKMINNNGYGFRILSYNTFMFTCAYLIEENDKRYLIVETPNHTIKILF
jgi:hypothetical protein